MGLPCIGKKQNFLRWGQFDYSLFLHYKEFDSFRTPLFTKKGKNICKNVAKVIALQHHLANAHFDANQRI